MLRGFAGVVRCQGTPAAPLAAALRWIASNAPKVQSDTFPVQPGSLLHICCTHPDTQVLISNKPGVEDAVTLQVRGSGHSHGWLCAPTITALIDWIRAHLRPCTSPAGSTQQHCGWPASRRGPAANVRCATTAWGPHHRWAGSAGPVISAILFMNQILALHT